VTLVAVGNNSQITLYISSTIETVLEIQLLKLFSPLANKNYSEKAVETVCLVYQPG